MSVEALLVWRDGRTAFATVGEPPPVFLAVRLGGPKGRTDALDRTSPPSTEFVRGAGHSRLPIYEERQPRGDS